MFSWSISWQTRIKGWGAALKSSFGDLVGLAFTFFGLGLSLSEFPDPVLNAWLSLVLTAAGFIITMWPGGDGPDKIPINPIRNIEEIISGVGLAYAIVNLRGVMGW